MSCCAIGCKNRFESRGELHFYRIPRPKTAFDEDRRERWIQAIRRRRSGWSEKTIRTSRLCSQHFITGKFSLDPNHPDFVPSVFSFSRHSDLQRGLRRLESFNRRVKLTECKGEAYVPDQLSTVSALCVLLETAPNSYPGSTDVSLDLKKEPEDSAIYSQSRLKAEPESAPYSPDRREPDTYTDFCQSPAVQEISVEKDHSYSKRRAPTPPVKVAEIEYVIPAEEEDPHGNNDHAYTLPSDHLLPGKNKMGQNKTGQNQTKSRKTRKHRVKTKRDHLKTVHQKTLTLEFSRQ